MTSGERTERLTSVATAARILRSFDRQATQLGVSELARRTGASKSSAHRIIWTLVEECLLEKVEETGLFRLTTTMRSLGQSAETAQSLHEAATMPLDQLRAVTSGTLQIGILDGVDVLYIERREGPGTIPVFRDIGSRNAAHATSSGKVLLAHLPREPQALALDQLRMRRKTPRTITTRAALVSELGLVRRQGYAENKGESEPGMCSLAAPVREPLGRVVASVSVAMYVDDVEAGLAHLAAPVTLAAARISAALGWQQ